MPIGPGGGGSSTFSRCQVLYSLTRLA
jgi:hypothetical protein